MADFVSVENTIAQLHGFNPRKKIAGGISYALVWRLCGCWRSWRLQRHAIPAWENLIVFEALDEKGCRENWQGPTWRP